MMVTAERAGSVGGLPQTVLPVVAALGGFGLGLLLFFGQLQQTRQLRGQLEQSRQRIAELDAKNQDLSREINGLQGERNRLEARVSSLQAQFTTAAADLERNRTSSEELQRRFDALGEERTKLEVQVASLTGERNEVRSQLERTERSNTELERSVSRLRERYALLDRDYRQLTEKTAQLQNSPSPSVSVVSTAGPTTGSATATAERIATASSVQGTVELPPIIVRKDQAGISMPVRGRLLEVNGEHNFVVVDKGSADGVRVGMTFDVLRGSTPVGRATVVRVRPQLSACDVVRAKTPSPLQPGDAVVQSGP